MPSALPENVQANDVGHINHTNTMHEARNRIVSVGRGVIYVDPVNGADSNDGLSLAYPKETLAGAESAAGNGTEIRCVAGAYNISTGVSFTDKKGIRILGEGGNSRDLQLGTRFRAVADGINLLTFEGPSGIVKEGPEIANISFIDGSPTGQTAQLLTLSNQNRWQIQRCDFLSADIGLWIEEDFSAPNDDNAWNQITGSTHFTHNRVGLWVANGAGMRDYGSEFTANTELNARLGGQGYKFFGSSFDGQGMGGIIMRGNHHMFLGCKFEAIYDPANQIAIDIEGNGLWSGYGNHCKVLFCSFTGFGSLDPSVSTYINVQSGCRWTQIIGNIWVNSGNKITDNGFLTTYWNPQTLESYTASNVTTDRSFDANSTTLDELADVVGTLISDLRGMGIVE